MNSADLLKVLAKLHQEGHTTVTARRVADALWPDARQNNTRGQAFNLAAGVAARMLGNCRAAAPIGGRTWTIVPEYLVEHACIWTENDEYWESQCGHSFIFTDCAKPSEHTFNYCPFCGKPLTEQPETPA